MKVATISHVTHWRNECILYVKYFYSSCKLY